jgi:hypothetical protein
MPLSRRELELVIKAQNNATRAFKQVTTAMRDVQRHVKQLDKSEATIEVNARVQKAVAGLNEVTEKAKEVDRIKAKLDVADNTREVKRRTDQLKKAVQDLDRAKATVTYEVAAAGMLMETERAKQAIDSIDKKRAVAKADLDASALRREVRKADRELDRLDGRSVNATGRFNADEMMRGLRIMRMLVIIPTLASGVALLGSAFVQAGAGAVALASAVGQAVGVLGALPGLAAAGVSGLAALFGAFWGVQDAVTELIKVDEDQVKSANESAKANKARAEAIREARKSLEDARRNEARVAQDNARAISDALEAVGDAEDDYRDVVRENARAIRDARRAVADAHRDHADTIRDNNQRIQEAEQQVADAVRNASEVRRQGAETVRAAEQTLRNAQFDLEASYDNLHTARVQAIQDLEDLKRATEDNALSIEGSEIALARARERLRQVNADTASSDLDVREARFAVAQAEASLTDTRRDAREEQEALRKAERLGVSGAPEVIAAQQQIRDAQEAARQAAVGLSSAQREAARNNLEASRGIAEAERNLKQVRSEAHQATLDSLRNIGDAERDLTETRREAAERAADALEAIADAEEDLRRTRQNAARAAADAARATAEAQRELRNALQAAADTANDTSAADERLAIAMGNLTPEGRRFARFLHEFFIPGLERAGHAAQREFLPPLQTALRDVGVTYFPVLNRHMGQTGNLLGQMAERAGRVATSGPWRRDIQRVLDNNLYLMQRGGEAGFHLADAFRNVAVAALPLTRQIADFTLGIASAIDKYIEARRASGDLRRFYANAWETFQQLWRMVTDLGKALWEVGKVGVPAGEELLDFFERLLQRFRDWTESIQGRNELREMFANAVPFVEEVTLLVLDLLKAFIDLGNTGGPTKIIRQIRHELMPALIDFMHVLTTDFAEDLINLLTSVLRLFTRITEEGSGLEAFLKTFDAMARAVNELLDVPGLGKFVNLLLQIGGVGAAIGLTVGTISRFGRSMGHLFGFITPMRNFNRGLRGVESNAKAAATSSGRLGTNLRLLRGRAIDSTAAMMGGGGTIASFRALDNNAGRATTRLGRLRTALGRIGASRTGRAAGAAAAATAIGGIALASDDSSTAVNALNYGAMGAMTGMIAGPWGAAIGGAIGLVYGFATGEDKATKDGDELTRTLNRQSGALTGHTRKLVATKLAEEDAFDSANQLKLGHRQVTDAVMRGGGAYDRLKERLQRIIDVNTHLVDAGAGPVKIQNDQARAAQRLMNAMEGQREAVGKASAKGKELARNQRQVNGVLGEGSRGANKAGRNFRIFSDDTKDLDTRVRALDRSFNRLVGEFLDVDDSAIDARDALASLRRALKDSGGAMGMATQKSRDARRAFNDATRSVKDHVQAVFDNTGNVRKTREAFQSLMPRLRDAAEGNRRAERTVKDLERWMRNLTKSVNDIPGRRQVQIDVNKKIAEQNIHDFVRNANRSLGNVQDETVRVRGRWSVNKKSGGITIDTLTGPVGTRERIHSGRGRIPEGLATGGLLMGPGTGTSDSIPALVAGTNKLVRVSNGEFVQRAEAVAREGIAKMAALNEGKATIVPTANGAASTVSKLAARQTARPAGLNPNYALGGTVVEPVSASYTADMSNPQLGANQFARGMKEMRNTVAGRVRTGLSNHMDDLLKRIKAAYLARGSGGDLTPNEIARGQRFARQQAGKPYVWGGVGPGGYDCSGFISAVYNACRGRNPYSRLGSTGTMPWANTRPGKGAFTVGWFTGSPGHISGTLGGMGVESTNGSVRIGGRARKPTDSLFNRIAHFTSPRGIRQFGGTYRGGGKGEYSGGHPQGIVRNAAARRGWDTGEQWRSLYKLIDSESSWRPRAENPSTTASGLFQFVDGTWAAYKRGSSASHASNASIAAQARAGMAYIKSRYGGPIGAWRFKQRNNWYRWGGPILRDRGGLLPRGQSVVQNNTTGNEHLSVMNKKHMQGLEVLGSFQRGGRLGAIKTRVRPRLSRVAGRQDVSRAYAPKGNETMQDFREWMREEFLELMTGSPKQVRQSRVHLDKQLDVFQKAIVEGLQRRSTRLEKMRDRINKRMEKLDETHHKRSRNIRLRAARVADRLEDHTGKGRYAKLTRQHKRVEKRLENLDDDATKQQKERLQKRAKELENRLENIESTGAQKRLRKRLEHLRDRAKKVTKEENKEIKKIEGRMEERVDDINRRLRVVRKRERQDIERAQNQFEKLLPRIQKNLRKEFRILENHAERLVKMNKRLDKARGILTGRQTVMSEFAAAVRETTAQFTDILGIQPSEGNFLFTPEYIEQQMRGKLTEVERFRDNLNKLADMGLSDQLFKKFAEQGVEAAGRTVEALAASTPDAVARINEMQEELNKAGEGLGKDTSEHLYLAGVQAAQGVVDGIEANIRQVEKGASKLARALIRAMKRALGIKSPSSLGIEIGRNIAQATALGIESEERAIQRAADTLGSQVSRSVGGGAHGAGVASSPKVNIEKQEINVTTQEIDPRKHAADLGWELVQRLGDM